MVWARDYLVIGWAFRREQDSIKLKKGRKCGYFPEHTGNKEKFQTLSRR